MNRTSLIMLAASGALASLPAAADADLKALRAEIAQMRQAYEQRINALEKRLAQTEGQAQAAQTTADRAARAPVTASAFNPEISLILQGQYAHRKDIAERHISGFVAGGHAHGGGGRGFSLDHTELVFAASIDPYSRGFVNLAAAPEGGLEVEEAWFQTTGLGRGFNIKGGRFLSGIGYINEKHPHAWDFADQNLMYTALFGEHLIQDGVQVKWLAPTETFLEFGLEAARGQNFPGSKEGGNKNGAGTWATFARIGGDVGASNSWRAGLNYLTARPKDREAHREDTGGVEADTKFTGKSNAWIADFVWKWAPLGNVKEQNFTFSGEVFRRNENGNLACADVPGGAASLCTGGLSDAYRSKQSGFYAQGVYQFMPRWRAGYRYDRLDSGSVSFGANPLAHEDYRPTKHTLMTDYSPSEFSRFRLQFARDKSMLGITDNQMTLQYIHSLGAHGAHRF
ncbi:MAG: carbohydrate porin [Rhodocyclaceae bacterium]|nr:carbohydrate porin [Rhodocyclaceae bacterium]